MKALLTALARLFVTACSRKPKTHTATVRHTAPVRLAARRPRTAAGFANVIVFETTCV